MIDGDQEQHGLTIVAMIVVEKKTSELLVIFFLDFFLVKMIR
jgi:hypothetical protein